MSADVVRAILRGLWDQYQTGGADVPRAQDIDGDRDSFLITGMADNVPVIVTVAEWVPAENRAKPNPPAGPSPVGRLDTEAIEAQRAHELEVARAVSQAVIVGPDDYLLLGWKNASTAQLETIRAKLRDQHPGVADRILIANGPDTVAVIKTHGEES